MKKMLMPKKNILFLLANVLLYSFNSCSNRFPGKVEMKVFEDKSDFKQMQKDIDLKDSPSGFASASGTASDIQSDQDLVGYGFNSATLEAKARVSRNEASDFEDQSTSTGQTVKMYFERVTNKSSLYDKLGIDVKASVKYGVFKGSAAMQLLESTSINTYSDYLLLKVDVVNSPRILKRRLLSNSAKAFLNNKATFLERYGNEFFYGKVTGGQLCILFNFSSNNSDSRRKLQASLNLAANTLLTKASLTSTMETIKNTMSDNTSTKIVVSRIGDKGEIVKPDLESLINYALIFPEKVLDNSGSPKVISLLSAPITTIEDLPAKFKDSDFLIFNQQRQYLNTLAMEVTKIQDYNANYQFAIDNTNGALFADSSIATSKDYLDSNKEAIEKFTRLYEDCSTAIQACKTDATSQISYKKYVPIAKVDLSQPVVIQPNSIEVGNDELRLVNVPLGQIRTIEFRGNWKTTYGRGLPHDGPFNDYQRPPCAVPAEEIITGTDPFWHPPAAGIPPPPPIPLWRRNTGIHIIQRDILTSQIVGNDVISANTPFTTKTGVNVFASANNPIEWCDPPKVSALIYN